MHGLISWLRNSANESQKICVVPAKTIYCWTNKDCYAICYRCAKESRGNLGEMSTRNSEDSLSVRGWHILWQGTHWETNCVPGLRETDAPCPNFPNGPIIEREGLGILTAGTAYFERDGGTFYFYGPTPLIAAMRCYVASKLGDEIEIPEELL